MKLLVFSILINIFSMYSYADEKVQRTKKQIQHLRLEEKFLFSWRLSYSGIDSGDGQGVNVFGLEAYSRYALNKNHGFNFGLTKLVTFEEDYIVENGAIGTRVSAGYSFALTGSLVDRTDIYKINRFYYKGNTFKIKNKTVTKERDFDGFRVDLSVAHMNFNSYQDNLFSISPSIYYEQKINRLKLQYGVRYDHAVSSSVDVNFMQVFVGVGFTP